MKKLISLILALTLAASLCACGGGKSAAKTIDLDALGTKLAESAAFSDTMSQPGEDIAQRVYGYDAEGVKKVVLYTGTGATAEEIFLAEASDAKAASALKTVCEARVENQKQVFERYSPEDVAKLDSAVLVTEGNYVLLVVANDSAAAGEIVNGAIGG